MSLDWREDISKRLILDNGSNTIRFGTCIDQQPKSCLNLLALDKQGQLYYGDNLQNKLDETNLTYIKPQVRGVVTDWENEVQLWEKLLEPYEKQIPLSCLTLTYHPGIPDKVRQRMMEICFDYFQFDSFYPTLSQSMIREYYLASQIDQQQQQQQQPQQQNYNQFQLVIESTHSATYFVPFFDSEPINYAIKRLDIGGRILNKHLKEIINFKYIKLKNEIRLAQEIKEKMCYVSLNFKNDIKKKPFSHKKYFILPDFDTGKRGYAVDQLDEKSYQESMPLDKETFQIPEIIFNPTDIGLRENGLTQTTLDIIKYLNSDIKEYYLENIILAGGNAQFPNFAERLQQDLRENTPQYLDTQVNFIQEKNPVFLGAQEFCLQEEFVNQVIKKQEYKELGFDKLNKMYFV